MSETPSTSTSDVIETSDIADDVTPVILLCCGSFNPIHVVHLRMFELGRDVLHKTGKYQVIEGIISPVHDDYGKKDLAPASHRCAMIQRAIKSSDWIRLDMWECHRECWLETAKVLEHHQKLATDLYYAALTEQKPAKRKRTQTQITHYKTMLRKSPYGRRDIKSESSKQQFKKHVQVKLLMGFDVMETLTNPVLWTDDDLKVIVGDYGVIVKCCENVSSEKIFKESYALSSYKDNIQFVTDWTHHSCSSTKVRAALQKGDSVKYLLDDSVIQYIYKHQLYGTGIQSQPKMKTPRLTRNTTC